MKRIIVALIVSVVASIALTPATSHALVELRANYGFSIVDPRTNANYPALSQLSGVGLDAIISPPLLPIAFGLRYEQLGFDESNQYASIDVDIDRVAAILSIRIIDTLLYLGGIGTVGINHSGSQSFDDNTNNALDVSEDIDVDMSYTLGLEGGVKVAGLLLGAEAGYSAMTIKNSNAGQQDLELNGTYLKAHIGVDF